MKFAKVLFFICVIGICSAAAIERATSKAAAEYTAATKAAKVEVGYKEFMQRFNPNAPNPYANQNNIAPVAKPQNTLVNIETTQGTAKAMLDYTLLLNDKQFNSGIPFFFTAVPTEAVILSNMVKLKENSYYIPHNTITQSCAIYKDFSDPNAKKMLQCMISNKSGNFALKMIFDKQTIGIDVINIMATTMGSASGKRKTWISDKFRDVAEALTQTIYFQKQLSWIKSDDATIKAAKQASIDKVKLQIKTLEARLVALQANKVTLSGQLQTTQTTISETLTTKTKKITYKLSLEVTIKQLEQSISTKAQVEVLTKSVADALQKVTYWLDGSIYHRVINASEKTGLLGLINNNAAFDAKVNDYFFPQ